MSTLLANYRGIGAHEKHHLLTTEKCDEADEFETSEPEYCSKDCKKKHGVVCRILTTLHLKRRGLQDHQNLLSESQEVFPEVEKRRTASKKEKHAKNSKYKLHVDDDDENEKSCQERPRKSKKKKERSHSAPMNNNNTNNSSSSKYKPLGSRDGLNESCEILVQVTDAKRADSFGPTIIEKNEISAHIHVYGDANFGESYITEKEDSPLVEKTDAADRTTGEYFKHKWHGKRAKKARKRIRRAARATWASLQTSLNINNMIPTTNTFATTFTRNQER